MSIPFQSNKPKVASLVWQLPSQLHEVQGKIVEKLGYPHQFLYYDQPIPADVKIILIQGPYGSLLPLARNLMIHRSTNRPILAYWFQQSLDLTYPNWMLSYFVRLFSDLHRYYGDAGWLGSGLELIAPQIMRSKGTRLGFAGDIIWLHRQGVLDLLTLSSTTYARYFKQYGVQSLVVPRGYHPSYGRVLNLERDIAVVWMGKTRTKRRKRAIYRLRDELKKRGQTMLIHDGEENDFIFSEKRTQILNRTYFVLNLFPHPTWELSIRYFVAAANGAVVITEPGENEYPFIPGKHLVECAVEEMPDRIIYYQNHQDEWRSISYNMHNLIQQELTLERSIIQILSAAEDKVIN